MIQKTGLFLLAALMLQCFNAHAQFDKLLHQADSTLKSLQTTAAEPKQNSTITGSTTVHKSTSSSPSISSGAAGKTSTGNSSAAATSVGQTTSTQRTTSKPAEKGISLPDMTGGIKQALEKGLLAGVQQVSAPDGFLKNAAIKLAFPPEARQAEQTLRSLGMNKLCDDVIVSMNRAAEDATKKAIPIFLAAIKKLSIKDAEGILAGPDNAATQFFQNHTNEALAVAFKPVIDSSLRKVNADTYYKTAASAYNKIPFTAHKLNTDLAVYATQKATEGLFKTIADQELKIRTESGARSTPLMKKVFGYFEKH